jgi:hypothetical protein
MFVDSDIIVEKYQINEMISQLKDYDIVKPYNKNILKLNRQQKYKYIYEKIIPDLNQNNLFTISGGVTLFKGNIVGDLGGYEEFNFYGYEDRFMDVKILNKNYKIHRNNYRIIHLWHPGNGYKRSALENKKIEGYNKLYYNCTAKNNNPNEMHEKCNHISTEMLIKQHMKSNFNLNLFVNNFYSYTINLKNPYPLGFFQQILSRHKNISEISKIPINLRWEQIQKLNVNEKELFVKECNKYSTVEYKHMFKNKKVAIIGPSPSVRFVKDGKYIDENYDIIIRINKQWKVIEDTDYIGTRTDILYNCIDRDKENGGTLDTKYLENIGLKLIVDPIKFEYNNNNNRDYLFKCEQRLNDYVYFHLNNKLTIPFGMIDKELYDLWDSSAQTRFNTGVLAILDVLNSDCKEIYVKGFSFFKDGYISSYRNEIDGKKCNEQESHDCVINRLKSGNHDQEKQWSYLKKLLEDDNMKSKFKPSKTLEKILNLDKFSDFIN